MIITGVVARRLKWLKREADSSFMRMAIDVTLPCFIVYNMLGNEKLKSVGFSLTAIGLGALILLITISIAWIAALILRLKVGGGKRTFVVTTAFHNYGFFIIALVSILFGSTPNDELIGVILTHNVGCDLVFWSLGLFLLSNGAKFSFRVFARGPVIAVFVGLFIVWTGLGQYVPVFVKNSLGMIGGCAIPLNLFIFGTLIYDMYGGSKVNYKLVSWAVLVRMGVMPAAIVALAVFLPVDPMLKKIIVLQALPPCGVTTAVLTREFGGNSDLAVHITLATCIVACATLPLWMNLGFGFVGGF